MSGKYVGCREQRCSAKYMQDNPFAGVKDFDETCGVLGRVAGRYGLPCFSYLQLQGSNPTDRFIANYPAEWRARYERKRYVNYDPIVAAGRRVQFPFFWNNINYDPAASIGKRSCLPYVSHNTDLIKSYKKTEKKIFHEAFEFSINAGYSVPIAGKVGELGLFSIVARSDSELSDVMEGAPHLIYVLGLQLHDHVLSLGDVNDDRTPDIQLSARELECLKWLSDGLTTEQIADKMVISAATVNYHFNKIVPKFDGANRHHAAIKAIRLGMI